jgi:hypothetical protein
VIETGSNVSDTDMLVPRLLEEIDANSLRRDIHYGSLWNHKLEELPLAAARSL